MVIYNFKKFKVNGRGGFDDGSYITLRGIGRQKGFILFHKKMIERLGVDNPKAVELLYDPSGYMAFRFIKNRNDFNCYSLRNASKVKFQIISKIAQKFEQKKYFKENVELKDGLAIIKVDLTKDMKIYPEDFEEDTSKTNKTLEDKQ